MSDVRPHYMSQVWPASKSGGTPPNGGGQEPPMSEELTERVGKLEEHADDARLRLDRIENKLTEVTNHYATQADVADMKAEMHKGFSDIVRWMVGTAIVLGAAAITVMTFVLNNAVPKAPAAQPAPIVITVPAAPAAASPPPAQ